MKKKLIAIVATMAVLCMSLMGCGSKIPAADETMVALFDLYVKDDAVQMKDLLGFESEEDVQNAFFEEGADYDMVEDLKAEFAASGLELDDSLAQELTDTMTDMMNKTSCTAEITSEEGDVTVVTLKVIGFSYTEMENVILDAANTMMESISEEDLVAISGGDMEVFAPYMEQYVKDFMAGFASMETLADPVEVTVECEKQIVDANGKEITAWLPTDMDGFATDVDNAIYQEVE